MLAFIFPLSWLGCSTSNGAGVGDAGQGGTNATGGTHSSTGGNTTAAGSGTGGVSSACDPACSGAKPVCNEPTRSCVQCVGNGDCSGASPVCNTALNTCVQCTQNSDCSGGTPGCNTTSNTCVQCTKDSHCSGTTPICDTNKSTCVACLSNADCTSATNSLCSSGACVPCGQDDDCSEIDGKNVCSSGVCVECTGTKYAACAGDAGPANVCDSLQNVCTSKLEHSADLCQPCVSDAECKLGRVCVQQQFGASSVGYFCFFKQGDVANGAPADCTVAGRPYVSAIPATSIDSEVTTICGLRASTCTARNQYSQTNCASSINPNIPDKNLCGFAPGTDSECTTYGASQFRCTVACGSDDDCPIIGATPMTCSITSGTRKYCSL